MSILNSIFKSHSEKELKRIEPIVNKVMSLEDEYAKLRDEELVAKTSEFKNRLEAGETLDDILPEAFATVREASYRVLGMKPYKVQVIGGIVIHQGRISEMKTGEGKTLVATMPVYLNALSGKGVHVVTVNDYLAKRDSEWMGKLYRFLGLTVGLIIHEVPMEQRKSMYACDIVYGTNNEFGFDYLRDNMVVEKEKLAQRELNFAIVDEVDSILIDEARTPLIISGRGTQSSDLYVRADKFVRGLKPFTVVETDDKVDMDEIVGDCDYVIDEKASTSVLTSNGVAKAEKFFEVENLSDPDNLSLQHYINNALKAHGNFKRDQKYIVSSEGEVVIVDDFTGRLMPGRRYSDGLHQAIEAKEGVKIADENKTLATITFQNFFRMYTKLSGMTGTACTEEDEFRSIYNLDVIQIPTNRPVIRRDDHDVVYKTQRGKYTAVLKEVMEANKKGQPVLIGTVNVDKSEYLSKMFTKAGIKHNVLNAKNHMKEAEIVAQAGRKGAVTIATNMAGRGTDIILGGNAEFMSKQQMRKMGYDEELIEASTAHNETDDELILEARKRFADLKEQFSKEIEPVTEEVKALGGLYIIGTERHESRRIDNQLRGRSGRQGDPGRSKFFLALDDDLLRIFGGDRATKMFNAIGVDENMEIQNPLITKIVKDSQRKLEGMHFGSRKQVLEYDDVMNIQRTITYEQRRRVIDGDDVHDTFITMLENVATRIVNQFNFDEKESVSEKYTLGMKLEEIYGELPVIGILKDENAKCPTNDEIIEQVRNEAIEVLKQKEEMISTDVLHNVERVILLTAVDNKWMDQIDAMDQLRTEISMRSVAQHDPIVEYKMEGSAMFEDMNNSIQEDAVKGIMRGHFSTETRMQNKSVVVTMSEGMGKELGSGQVKKEVKAVSINSNEREPQQPVKRDENKVGRNDLCPCGSGLKYKNCCGKNQL